MNYPVKLVTASSQIDLLYTGNGARNRWSSICQVFVHLILHLNSNGQDDPIPTCSHLQLKTNTDSLLCN